jgi:hypothetical protein
MPFQTNRVQGKAVKYRLLLAAIVVAVLAAAGQRVLGQQQTAYGCYDRRSGTLRKVADANQCRPEEIFISWTVPQDAKPSYPSIPSIKPQPPKPPTASRISVYDAEDRFIGLLLDARPPHQSGGDGSPAGRGSLTFYLSDLDKFIEVVDDGSSISANFSSKPFYYDRLNCRGNAYIVDPTSFYFVHAQKDADGSSVFGMPLWVPEPPCVEFESRLSDGACETVSAEEASSCSAVPLLEVSLPFDLPLAMPLKFK